MFGSTLVLGAERHAISRVYIVIQFAEFFGLYRCDVDQFSIGGDEYPTLDRAPGDAAGFHPNSTIQDRLAGYL